MRKGAGRGRHAKGRLAMAGAPVAVTPGTGVTAATHPVISDHHMPRSAAADPDGQVLQEPLDVDRGHRADATRGRLAVERDEHARQEDMRVDAGVTRQRDVRYADLRDRAGLDGREPELGAEDGAARGHDVGGVELVGDVAAQVDLRRADVGVGLGRAGPVQDPAGGDEARVGEAGGHPRRVEEIGLGDRVDVDEAVGRDTPGPGGRRGGGGGHGGRHHSAANHRQRSGNHDGPAENSVHKCPLHW